MKVSLLLLEAGSSRKIFIDADVFVSKKKRHVHTAFKIPIFEYNSFNKVVDFISK